jgi:adenosylcobinamide kinase/adenosylcobinamide-phosphate guanylyltransferase
MSNLIANEMFQAEGAHENTVAEVLEGIKGLKSRVKNLVVVTNEIFSEAVSYAGETEQYQKYLGQINQEMGKIADEVVEVVYGIAIFHKGGSSC